LPFLGKCAVVRAVLYSSWGFVQRELRSLIEIKKKKFVNKNF